MMAQEKEWHAKANEELETIEKLSETCEKLKAEKRVLEVKVQFLCYLNRTGENHIWICHNFDIFGVNLIKNAGQLHHRHYCSSQQYFIFLIIIIIVIIIIIIIIIIS
jgi:hypothetical protein